jgi:hypothetical protein
VLGGTSEGTKPERHLAAAYFWARSRRKRSRRSLVVGGDLAFLGPPVERADGVDDYRMRERDSRKLAVVERVGEVLAGVASLAGAREATRLAVLAGATLTDDAEQLGVRSHAFGSPFAVVAHACFGG